MMRYRDVERQNQSPIRRDLVRGSGGLGTGWFTMDSSDSVAFDATSGILGTESGNPVVTDTTSATPVRTTT